MQPTAGLILAAGLGTRFGGRKLQAPIDGRPMLQHVLDLARAAGLDPVIVVLGADAAELTAACSWHGEQRVLNELPETGLSGSVRLGLDAVAATEARRVLVLLADQPRLSLAQVDAVLAAPADAARPIVVPRYRGRPGNPVLLERVAWPLAARLRGDRGMSQLFRNRARLVRHVDVSGDNPDVDTLADLEQLNAR